MKASTKMIVVVLATIGIITGSFFLYVRSFVGLADDFFAAVKNKNADEAKKYLPGNGEGPGYAAVFRDLVPSGADLKFSPEPFYKQIGVLSEQKTIEGTIHPVSAEKPIPVTIVYLEEEGDWKVREVKENTVQGQKTSAEQQEHRIVMTLARKSIADFVVAKKQKSMKSFYGVISDAWRKETSVEQLNEAFKPVLEDPTDWSFLNTVEPTITKYLVDKQGVLVVVGVYPSKPKRLIFEQNFINENNVWKLAGFKLYTADPEGTAQPTVTPQPQATDDGSKKTSTSKSATDTKKSTATKKSEKK